VLADLDDQRCMPFLSTHGRKSADAADQECRSVRFMVVEIDISPLRMQTRNSRRAGLLFRDDHAPIPNSRRSAAAVGGENGE